MLSLTGNLLGADDDSGGYAVVTSETASISGERFIGTALGAIAGVIVASRYGSSFIMFGKEGTLPRVYSSIDLAVSSLERQCLRRDMRV